MTLVYEVLERLRKFSAAEQAVKWNKEEQLSDHRHYQAELELID